jgi:hypothetical protein
MSEELNTDDSGLNKLKRICKEQLWWVFLLAPLLIVAVQVAQDFQADKKTVATVKKSAAVSASVGVAEAVLEISSSELASIVAKPIAELLVMDVYFDNHKKSRGRTRVSSLDKVVNVEDEGYNQPLNNIAANDVLVEGAYNGMVDVDQANKVKEHS